MERDVLELASSLVFVDEMYERYLADEGAVDESWHALLGDGNGSPTNGHARAATATPNVPVKISPAALVPMTAPGAFAPAPGNGVPATVRGRPSAVTLAPLSAAPTVWPLVNAFRTRGHMTAHLDPLGLHEAPRVPELEPATWGFTEADWDREISPTGVHGLPRATLRQLVEHLTASYGASIGLEMMHIASPTKRTWLADRMETRARRVPDAETRRRIHEMLVNAESFERFCHVKYPGTKRFSLEGSETVIPMVDLVLSHGARLGAIESVIGMAHRGRLTALESIMKRAARDIFAEFEDVEPEAALGGGDVKYHLGYSTDRVDANGSMHVSLSFNPSHLEAVDPVVVGRVRAKQTRHGDVEHRQVLGVLVHGDAAFAGQGLVAEVLNLTSLPGYRTGGTVHIIVNNQVGFTASPAEARSTPYCTDVAKMIECPIWHVNGEDPDAVAQVVEMAMEYRAQFGSDVVIDMYCYRKYGHNEMDEPGFTQPIMYDRIQHKQSVVEIYRKRLIDESVLSPSDVTGLTETRQRALEVELEAAKSTKVRPKMPAFTGLWHGYKGGSASAVPDVDTGVPKDLIEKISASMTHPPTGFTPHPKIVRLLEQRAQMGRGERPIDWGMGEMLAYGSLLWGGTNVRLTGQDCSRGTFSHRHALITDIKTGSEHLVLGQLHPDQGQCRIYDSPLSEAGVMGFEFGYSLDYPDALVMWEAQFGDFVNGAQVVVDQFLTSSEDKWHRLSGLVLLLPHGYEGQGPEHSSARLERFLQSCAEDNYQVAQPTTPAQMFHLLRRQVLRPWRKPLVVMTPKSLLRLPAATSTVEDFTSGTFQRVIVDAGTAAPETITRALFCTGKIYYELVEERRKRKADDVAIVRLEQLYPWRVEHIEAAFAPFTGLERALWVQDEPANMGAAWFVLPRLDALLEPRGLAIQLAARDESASPATGSHKAHVMEQERILRAAFDGR